MRKLILVVSATAMAVAMPAMAKPGKGGGQGGAKAHAGAAARVGPAHARGKVRTRADIGERRGARTERVSTRGRSGARIDRTRDLDSDGIPDHRDRRIERADRTLDRDLDGIPDIRDRRVDGDRDGIDDRAQNRYGANACPPGLAAKNNGCLPPGQARKMFAEGQRIPSGYDFYTPFDNIPVEFRDRYSLNSDGRYIYRDGRIYDVDPTTQIVRRIIEGLR